MAATEPPVETSPRGSDVKVASIAFAREGSARAIARVVDQQRTLAFELAFSMASRTGIAKRADCRGREGIEVVVVSVPGVPQNKIASCHERE